MKIIEKANQETLRRMLAGEADHVGQRGDVAQLEAVQAGDGEPLPDRREHLGLLDGVHAQVGLQVETEVEQVTRVPGQALHDIENGAGHLVQRGTHIASSEVPDGGTKSPVGTCEETGFPAESR